MKRKIFSKLLMVALVIAAVGSFVSCKDYDDDINNLQKQIDAKAAISELTALQSTLDSKIAAAQSAAEAAAKTAATNADAALKADLEKAIADAKKAGTDAGTEAGKAITAANEAKETAQEAAQAAKDADAAAKEALAEALKTIGETYQTKADAEAALKTIAESYATKAEAEEIKTSLASLKSDLESAIEEKISKAIAELGNASASVAAIWKAATSVELCPAEMKFGPNLMLLTGKKVANKFGDESYSKAVEIVEYEAGKDIEFTNRIIVRVNPVNADLSTLVADGKLFLINSLKETLNDYVDFGTPTRYTELVTRAYDGETGLWAIPVTLKKGIDQKALNKASHYNAEDATAAGYAIGINNTDTEERYAVSSYDLKPITGPYNHCSELTFTVNGKDASTLKTRWNGAKFEAEDGTRSDRDAEYVWSDSTQYHPTPATSIVLDATTAAATNPQNVKFDADGTNRDYVVLKNYDDDIVIDDVAGIYKNDGRSASFVEYYYVVLDSIAALESDPSEINAWNDAEIKGDICKMMSATEKAVINVTNPDAEGDIIGFRVYAVNYDGTLADPDGVAFYVQLGTVKRGEATASGNWNASTTAATADRGTASAKALSLNNIATIDVKENGALLAINGTFEDLKFANAVDAAKGTVTVALNSDKSNIANDGSGVVYYALLDADKAVATNWKDVKYVKVAVANAAEWINYNKDAKEGTVEFEIKGKNADNHNALVNTLKVTMNKVLATTATEEPTFMPTYGPDASGVLTIWFKPTSATAFATAGKITRPTATQAEDKDAAFATWGEANMNTYVKDAQNYKFEFVGAGEAKYNVKSGRFAQNAVANIEVAGAAAGSYLWVAGPIAATGAKQTFKFEPALPYATASIIDGSTIPEQTFEVAATTDYASKIDGTTQRTLNIYEDAEAISLAGKNVAKAAAKTYGLLAKSLKAVFAHDVMNKYQSYTLPEYMYTTALKATDLTANDWTKGIQKSNEYYMSYNELKTAGFTLHPVHLHANGDEPASTETAAGTVAGNINVNQAVLATVGTPLVDGSAFAKFSALIEGKNSVWTANYTTLVLGNYAAQGTEGLSYGLAPNNYTFYASFTSDATSQEDYVQVRIHDTTNNLMFRVTPAGIGGASGNAPISDVPSHLTIKATDAFGNAVTILDEAIILKP